MKISETYRTLTLASYFENYPPQDSESATRNRIPAPTEYLYRLRE